MICENDMDPDRSESAGLVLRIQKIDLTDKNGIIVLSKSTEYVQNSELDLFSASSGNSSSRGSTMCIKQKFADQIRNM